MSNVFKKTSYIVSKISSVKKLLNTYFLLVLCDILVVTPGSPFPPSAWIARMPLPYRVHPDRGPYSPRRASGCPASPYPGRHVALGWARRFAEIAYLDAVCASAPGVLCARNPDASGYPHIIGIFRDLLRRLPQKKRFSVKNVFLDLKSDTLVRYFI